MITSLHFKVQLGVIWAFGLNPTSEVVQGLLRLFEAVFRKSCIWHFFIMSGRIEAIPDRFLKKLHLTLVHHIGANWGHSRPFFEKAAHDSFSSYRGELRRWRWWPPLPPEAKNWKCAILLILMVELKVCAGRAPGVVASEASQPPAGLARSRRRRRRRGLRVISILLPNKYCLPTAHNFRVIDITLGSI